MLDFQSATPTVLMLGLDHLTRNPSTVSRRLSVRRNAEPLWHGVALAVLRRLLIHIVRRILQGFLCRIRGCSALSGGLASDDKLCTKFSKERLGAGGGDVAFSRKRVV